MDVPMLSVQFISTMERHMIKSGIGIALVASLVGLSGCATKAETIGTAGGRSATRSDAIGPRTWIRPVVG